MTSKRLDQALETLKFFSFTRALFGTISLHFIIKLDVSMANSILPLVNCWQNCECGENVCATCYWSRRFREIFTCLGAAFAFSQIISVHAIRKDISEAHNSRSKMVVYPKINFKIVRHLGSVMSDIHFHAS